MADTGHHKPKTWDSYRTIPVCGEMLAALKAALAVMMARKVQPITGELFTDREGNPWKVIVLSSRWMRALMHAAAVPEVKDRRNGRKLTVHKHGPGLARLGQVPARKLRAAFATMAGRLGVPDRLLKAYLGHAAGDILGDHYRRIDPAELRLVSDPMEGWRSLASGAADRKESGNMTDPTIANA